MTTTKNPKAKRKHIRFEPDQGAYALLDFKVSKEFTPDMVTLIVEESRGGAGLVGISKKLIPEGQQLLAQVGLLSPLLAEVIWCKKLDKSVYAFGIKYLE